MTHLPDDRWPDDLQEVVDRLRRERPEPDPIQLDRIKLTAMKRATRTAGISSRRGLMRSGLAGPVLSIALVIVGVVAIAGATTGSPGSMGRSKGNSSHVQYCKQESKSHYSLRSGSSRSRSKHECEENCDNGARASSSSKSRSKSKSKSRSRSRQDSRHKSKQKKPKRRDRDDCDDD